MGFLQNGYKKEYYFWEIIIIYRKVIIVFVSIYVTAFGVIAQGLILLLTLILFTFLTLKLRPFDRSEFLELESLSLIITMITIYFGLFFISEGLDSTTTEQSYTVQTGVDLKQSTKLIFFILILLLNALFFIYWLIKMFKEFKSGFRTKFS